MHPLPNYARRIEYLESTGTQWIDTGVRGAGSGWLATKFMAMPVSDTGVYWRYFGASNGGMPNTRTIAVWSRTAIYYENGTTSRNLGGTGTIVTLDKQAYRVPEGSTVGDYNFKIFGYNGPTNLGSARFWYFKLWNSSGTPVRSFVPVRVGSVGYLFDRVSGQLFGNAGTGDFVLGPDTFSQGVVPTRMMPMGVRKRPYDAEVEYVESDGTQWADTGIMATGATATSLDARMVSTGTRNSGFFGAYSSGRSYYLYLDPSSVFQFGFGAYKNSSKSLDRTRHVFELEGYQFLVDGVVAGTTNTKAFSTPWTLAMFKTRSSASAFYAAPPVEVYGCQISQSGTLVRDFIPVRVGTVGALYDRVSGELFFSATSTALVPGPDLP